MSTEFERKIFPGLLEKIQSLMRDLQCEPEHFKDRIMRSGDTSTPVEEHPPAPAVFHAALAPTWEYLEYLLPAPAASYAGFVPAVEYLTSAPAYGHFQPEDAGGSAAAACTTEGHGETQVSSMKPVAQRKWQVQRRRLISCES